MENASKALIIAGAILISILIIAIGMGIYNSSKEATSDATAGMDTHKIDAFNAEWTNYEGTMSGSQVKAMIRKLIAHANTYQEEAAKVIGLECEAKKGETVTPIKYEEGKLKEFIGDLNDKLTDIQPKHNYEVSISFEGEAIIQLIKVKYEKTTP